MQGCHDGGTFRQLLDVRICPLQAGSFVDAGRLRVLHEQGARVSIGHVGRLCKLHHEVLLPLHPFEDGRRGDSGLCRSLVSASAALRWVTHDLEQALANDEKLLTELADSSHFGAFRNLTALGCGSEFLQHRHVHGGVLKVWVSLDGADDEIRVALRCGMGIAGAVIQAHGRQIVTRGARPQGLLELVGAAHRRALREEQFPRNAGLFEVLFLHLQRHQRLGPLGPDGGDVGPLRRQGVAAQPVSLPQHCALLQETAVARGQDRGLPRVNQEEGIPRLTLLA
mmetsp:Transcript_163727/g.525115  ORF Transcript_163727/g.525115 Transcript_163727/m.525115 type:complete len:282 (+) Transcript_163727:1805-2650(+)